MSKIKRLGHRSGAWDIDLAFEAHEEGYKKAGRGFVLITPTDDNQYPGWKPGDINVMYSNWPGLAAVTDLFNKLAGKRSQAPKALRQAVKRYDPAEQVVIADVRGGHTRISIVDRSMMGRSLEGIYEERLRPRYN